jgi:TonB family protein
MSAIERKNSKGEAVPSFGSLSTGQRNPASIAASVSVNVLILLLVIMLGLSARKALVKPSCRVTDLSLDSMPKPHKDRITPLPKRQDIPLPETKPDVPKVQMSRPLPMPVPVPEVQVAQATPVMPKAQVLTIRSSTNEAPQVKAAMAAPAAVDRSKASQTVSSAHFGDPLGAHPNPNAVRGVVAATAFGSSSGGGSGSMAPRGTVASAGIGGATAGTGTRTVAGHVGSAGIPEVRKTAMASPVIREAPQSTNLDIISKPSVRYTKEAREKKIQGSVILRVTFTAAGEVVVHGVVSGLGYGLDEEARRVAQEIRFHPATRSGRPVDVTTNVTISFQSA